MAPACFGDLELTARIDPFLTVIAQPAYELGRRAFEEGGEGRRYFEGAMSRIG